MKPLNLSTNQIERSEKVTEPEPIRTVLVVMMTMDEDEVFVSYKREMWGRQLVRFKKLL